MNINLVYNESYSTDLPSPKMVVKRALKTSKVKATVRDWW